MAFDFTQFLVYVPTFNFGEILLVLISTLLSTVIIYFWMRIFHEPPKPGHAFFVALIANLQNYFIPFLIFLLPIPYAFQVLPALVWILLIRLFYSNLDWKHAIIIALLSYGAHAFLESYGLARTIQQMIPIRF